MNRYLTVLFVAFLISGFCSCQNEEVNPPVNNNEGTKYEQYGTPFDDLPESRDIIMYEVNLRAFGSSNAIREVINKLDHIKSLGVNVVWLMPIYPVGQVNSVNSPYCVKNYKEVSAEYGTLSDLRDLTDAAHAKGMAVILDWVANHTSWDNPWIENKSWYTQDENGNIVNPPGTNWADVADLNYDNADMKAAMIDAMEYWVYRANIDGYRCDYADGVPYVFWKKAFGSLDTISGRDFIFFAEGTRNDHFTAGFDLNFGWQWYDAIKNVFNGQSVNMMYDANINEYSNTPAGKDWVRFTTNHDESAWDATPISLFNGIDGALAASVVTIFTGGVPLIYGSQEVGTANTVPFFSNSTINWGDNPEMLASYQKMLQYYAGSETVKTGQHTVFPNTDIACIKKSLNNEEVLILVNLRNTTVNYTVPSGLSGTSWLDIMTGNSVTLNAEMNFAPYKFYILER